MKIFRACFRNVLLALSGGAMLLAPSCKDEDIPKSAACDILMFSVDGQRWEIDGANITRHYPPETPEEPLVPTINLSPGATVNPPASEAQNFFADAGVAYTVTAEDGVTKKTYTARATRTPYAGCSITFFGVGDARWSISDSLITYVFPTKTEEALLTPAIGLSPGATVEPPASQAQNFFAEGGVTYTVTSEDGATQKRYHASARNRYSGCSIESFGVDGVAWSIEDTLISYFYPTGGTGKLTPTIVLSPGATVNPIAGDPQDFFADEGVKYTVTSEDSTATKTYTAKATVETSGGESWAWEVSGSRLTIRGVNGIMPNYQHNGTPWVEYREDIKSVTIEGMLNVGDRAFQEIAELSSLTMSNTVKSIGYYAFGYCRKLATVNIPNSVDTIGVAAFNECTGLTSLTLGNSLKYIGQFAFHWCEQLTTITLPSTLQYIGNHVFHRCFGLQEIISLNPVPPQAIPNAFGDTSGPVDKSRVIVKVPAGSVAAYRAADEWKDFPHIVEIY
ncbi:MAG: leucine-rich repeat protein [Prevotellaceae bacterium]|nr:leucine-rich repeat protein [Prevotellaceae bacterium]